MSKTRVVSKRFVTLVNKEAIPVEAPDQIVVVPWGDVQSKSGNFVVNQSVADDIISEFNNHGVDLVIDLEHATVPEFSPPDGAAPAMGWIKSFSVEVGRGIVALVEWTERGMNYVQKKEYRYLSPTLSMIRGTNRPVGLHSVALTNKPAIVGMVPIVNKEGNVPHRSKFGFFEDARFFLGLDESADEEKIMNELEVFLSKLRGLVSVADGATQTEVMAALSDRLKQGDELRLAVCKSLDVKPDGIEGSFLERVGEKLAALKAHADKTKDDMSEERDVLANAVTEAHEKIKILTENITDRDAGERIQKALSEGKLTEAMIKPNEDGSNHFLALARDKAGWDQFIERQPVVKPPKGSPLSSNRNSTTSPQARTGDPVLAHSERYDPDRLSDYERIKAYQTEHKVSYQEAMEACGA